MRPLWMAAVHDEWVRRMVPSLLVVFETKIFVSRQVFVPLDKYESYETILLSDLNFYVGISIFSLSERQVFVSLDKY